ncbi:hypothetical protein [Sphingobium yanoikuyae]|uniref:hypothetical protein n=1 Tax=Sphingobium yanoikuyae TaxID=13690 RepID=UPI0014784929|nr:hypothetical protein [Sphingobium yanoikuyae]
MVALRDHATSSMTERPRHSACSPRMALRHMSARRIAEGLAEHCHKAGNALVSDHITNSVERFEQKAGAALQRIGREDPLAIPLA